MRGAVASSSLSLFEGSPNSQQWPGLPFIRGWHFIHIVAWVKCQSFTNWASPNWAAQHDESGRVARYHLTWLEWYVVLRLSWQSTRFQNPRQKAGNDGPLFFWSPFSSTAEMVKLMIWVQVPDFWNIRRTDWQGASSSQNVHFLVIILYYIIYIYIIYIIYITTFLAGGTIPITSHSPPDRWIRSHRPIAPGTHRQHPRYQTTGHSSRPRFTGICWVGVGVPQKITQIPSGND